MSKETVATAATDNVIKSVQETATETGGTKADVETATAQETMGSAMTLYV